MNKTTLLSISLKYKWHVISLLLLFCAHLLLRFWHLPEHFSFGWDQIDNAWVAADMIDHQIFPEKGMVAKASTGFHIGPGYYYYVALFYALTNLDPIAAPLMAGFTSMLTFWALYFAVRSLFNRHVALLALFFHTYSSFIIEANRSPWPVIFIVPLSIGIYYALYRILTGSSRYALLLAALLGMSLHIHVTSIFFFIITFVCIFFVPWKQMRSRDVLYSVLIFLVLIIPIVTQYINPSSSEYANASGYVSTTYHGFHLRRMMQIAGDAFIEYSLIFPETAWGIAKYIVIPVFIATYAWTVRSRKSLVILLLSTLWILVPWIVFTTYSGEITNYYFYMTRPVFLIASAYLIYRFMNIHFIASGITIICLIYFASTNVYKFINMNTTSYLQDRAEVRSKIQQHIEIPRSEGYAHSYYYYVEKRNEK